MRLIATSAVSMGVLAVAAALVSPGASAAAAAGSSRHWSVVDSPTPGTSAYLADVDAASATDAWAVGQYSPKPPGKSIKTLIEHWDGAAWQVVRSPSPGAYTGFSAVLERSSDDVWAAGSFATRDGADQTLLEHWDGADWSVVPSPSPGVSADIYDLLAVGASGRLWAVGATQPTVFDTDVPLIESWNGSHWKVVSAPSPKHGGYLFGATAISDSDAWAVGQGGSHPLLEHWDGTSWTQVRGAPGVEGSFNETGSASSSDVWAVGEDSAGGALAEHWDGSSWSAVSTPRSNNVDLGAVVVGKQGAWAVGSRLSGADASTVTERWNGTAWHLVSSPNGDFPESSLFAVVRVPGTGDLWSVGISTNGADAATLIESLS